MSSSTNAPETALHRHLDRVRLDIGTDVGAQIRVSQRQLEADLEAELDGRFGALARTFRERPYARDWNTQGSADSHTYTVIRSGQCAAGLVWDVRRCAITAGGTGGDPFTVLSNAIASLVKYTLMNPTSSLLEPQFQLITSNGAVPNQYSSTRGGLIVKAGEELAFIVKAAASGTPLVASWGVEVYPEDAFHQP